MQPVAAISLRLKTARFVMGYKNAKAFAESFNIRYITYIQHEKAKRSIKLTTAYQYAQWLQINPAWLLTGQGHPCPAHPQAEEKQAEIHSLLHHEAIQKAHLHGYPKLAQNTKDILIDFTLWCELLLRLDAKNLTMQNKIKVAIKIYNQIVGLPFKPELVNTLVKTELAKTTK